MLAATLRLTYNGKPSSSAKATRHEQRGLSHRMKKTSVKSRPKTQDTEKDDCVFPPRVSDDVLNQFTLARNEYEGDRITNYVETECAKDKGRVTYLEKTYARSSEPRL